MSDESDERIGAEAANSEASAAGRITLGFTRGVSPSKWADRWRKTSRDIDLELVPVAATYGRCTTDCDVMIERAAPGSTPDVGVESGAEHDAPRSHHTMRLYEEAVALVLAKDHELAEQTEIHLDDLALLRILDHPYHFPEWPRAEPWDDPSWMPASPQAALELVASGLGGILMPLPLARHLTDKRRHAVLRVVDPSAEDPRAPLPGTTIWATWAVDRDAPDVQRLAGVLRGRTARSSRGSSAGEAGETRENTPAPRERPRTKQQPPAKQKPKLKPNSRGAQLAAAREKAERAKAAKRAAKRGKRR